ncbi:MG2 domain-containing protein [Rubinisphaera margarita]|uniref:MG2 domain-containing protein n=1 Tax=Rubinisphaera margarita TaxID=2909586 RepID=UPI001EE8CA47|nr:MG2 domain-containing protein [Rubinisphaera margarita]MCG6155538.1 MG2 domain-containing protein [Rubinisphaera margarita]
MQRLVFLAGILGLSLATVFLRGEEPEVTDLKSQADQLYQDGNYNEARQKYRQLVLRDDATQKQIHDGLYRSVECMQRLDRIDEADAYLEDVLKAHPKTWHVPVSVAGVYQTMPHHGFLVEGEFKRGNHRGSDGAQYVDASERDRVRALQLLQDAMSMIEQASREDRARFYLDFSQAIMAHRGSPQTSWELQSLTDLSTLPDYENQQRWNRFGLGPGGSGTQGAPVDFEGNPIAYGVPASWEEAKNDGERWRWLLEQSRKSDESFTNKVMLRRAEFALSQFGVQTLGGFPGLFGGSKNDEELDQETAPFNVRLLEEDETIAQLATGVKRFHFPEEYDPIAIFGVVAQAERTTEGQQALSQLAQIFENRLQYPRAVEYWRKLLEVAPKDQKADIEERIRQIVEPWGQFEGVNVEPAGEQVKIPFRFRNGESIALQAYELKYELLLEDVKAYLKSNPQKWNWDLAQIGDIGHRIVVNNETKYRGKSVAKWNLKLEPREKHFDRRISVEAPLKKAGAYLLVGTMKDGNTSRIVVWLDDLAIVKKPLDGKEWYYVADARTGEPAAGARLDMFGYKVNYRGNRPPQVSVSEFADKTDAEGQLILGEKLLERDLSWLVTVKTNDGRVAHLGFDRIWRNSRHWDRFNQVKVYAITDRPVYRPDQSVKFKFWVRRANFEADQECEFAGQKFEVMITDPRGEKLLEKEFTADEFGGFDGEIKLPKDAVLGNYVVSIPWKNGLGGAGNFRVEEYKKPEFEVTVDAPDKPVKLGEKITATVKAKYYFGAPVANGFVKYKVERSSHTSRWYPVEPWDWLYGNGYGWTGSDYHWYPGFHNWGLSRPTPWWWPHRADPPELIVENEVPLNPDGTITIEIDTELAKQLHGDEDHRYSITAEVVDESRRTIVGTGSVLVARQPFEVYTWLDRGYYNVGDVATVSVKAQTIAQKPIQGPVELKLLRITYDKDGKPTETEVESWSLKTNAQGTVEQKFKTAQPGQYRISCSVTDAEGNTREGGTVFTVRGEKSGLADFQFNDLEIIPDRKTYQPGETVKLMINTNQENSTVLLFVRPSNGVYLPPQTLKLNGKSTVVDIGVKAEDMPNFFVEAMTISGAEVYQEARDIVVPPEKRVINVEVQPSSERYLPGEEAKVELILTDHDGQPLTGSVVMTVYDRSVEYISGGSNVGDIQAHFWKFRRSHHPTHRSSLQRGFYNILKPGEKHMQSIGLFGDLAADMEPEMLGVEMEGFGIGGGGGGLRGRMMLGDAPAPASAPMSKMAVDGAVAEDASGEEFFAQSQTPEFVQPTVRTEFADTAYWAANITPDKNGRATVSFPMPENLTEWKLRAWSVGEGTRVGEGTASVVTAKDVLVRLQAPRFFVEKDEVVISANVHNYLKDAKSTRVEIKLEGDTLSPLDEISRIIDIPANGEVRVDWRVKATAEGQAVITVQALTDADSDAMQMTFPVYVHGMLKTDSYTGVIRPDDQTGSFEINIPEERRPEQSELIVRYSPTLAGALVDAIPYLIDYPYGCTEQTLNRFVPAVISQNVLIELGVDLEAIEKKRTNLNAQELGPADERAAQWKRYDRNPVFSTQEMEEIVKVGVKRLTDMQLSDGGWGWFSGRGEHSGPHTTATVVHGLQIAEANGVVLLEGVLPRGVEWLKKYQEEQIRLLKRGEAKKPKPPYRNHANDIDALVFMVLVDAGVHNETMQDYLYRDRTKLSMYSLAMFGLSLHKLDVQDKLDMVLRNIEQYYVEDLENQTAYLKLPAGYSWWYWHGNEIEANAYYLKLLTRVDPKGERASRLVKYLLNNRKHGSYWNSTRDTALCIEAMAEFLEASGEVEPGMTVQILVDGVEKKSVQITKDNLFDFDGTLVLKGEELTTGKHTIEFRKTGRGPLYWNGYATSFTLEDPITATGLELKVRRSVYKLVPQKDATANVAGSQGQVVNQNVEKFDRVELKPGDEVVSGDLIEIELGIDSKNDYEYILLEDFKAAGTEPVDVRSGYIPEANGAYVEFRDEKVAFFMRRLARGTSSMKYRLRAEIPGTFSALPTISYGMYAPELKANSDEFKLTIEELVRE